MLIIYVYHTKIEFYSTAEVTAKLFYRGSFAKYDPMQAEPLALVANPSLITNLEPCSQTSGLGSKLCLSSAGGAVHRPAMGNQYRKPAYADRIS